MDDMNKRGALGDLIATVCQANGWSYTDVANRANRTLGDQVLSKQNISRLVNEYPLTSITRGAIRALAAGLGVSADRVALAAVQSMGFRPPELDMSPAEAIQRDASMSADTKGALLAILRAAGERAG